MMGIKKKKANVKNLGCLATQKMKCLLAGWCANSNIKKVKLKRGQQGYKKPNQQTFFLKLNMH
jgi:hypothetical protein